MFALLNWQPSLIYANYRNSPKLPFLHEVDLYSVDFNLHESCKEPYSTKYFWVHPAWQTGLYGRY